MLATGNKDKVRELEALLAGTQVTAAPDGFDPDETGTTLVQNARIKAEALRPDAPADSWVMADDSGLFVHALDGRPGVYSSRYAGPDATYADNCNLLLKELGEIGDSHHRGAAFACVLYCIAPDGAVLISSGVLPGEITREAAGADGFGYDPVFRPLSDPRTLAEMTRDEKAEISHRGRAARGMARMLGIAGADGGAGGAPDGAADAQEAAA
ncbi:MAG: RdgB/HAM1 family non-canonical purine NTP pyrophosphatase [Actinomycetota bacterium]